MEKYSEESINDLYKIIGKNVKYHRMQKKMTQLDLSLEMGYKSVSLVSAAELNNDNTHFNIAHLHKISRILDIEMCEFFKEN
jgi:transcriptional regulator with XRE-family HTH domain